MQFFPIRYRRKKIPSLSSLANEIDDEIRVWRAEENNNNKRDSSQILYTAKAKQETEKKSKRDGRKKVLHARLLLEISAKVKSVLRPILYALIGLLAASFPSRMYKLRRLIETKWHQLLDPYFGLAFYLILLEKTKKIRSLLNWHQTRRSPWPVARNIFFFLFTFLGALELFSYSLTVTWNIHGNR